jgi:uncharacterized protein DUF3592
VSSDGQSSKTSKSGCGWRATTLAIGGFALAACALLLFSAASSWWTGYQVRNHWRAANATIQHCEIAKRKRRSSTLFSYVAECAITFSTDKETIKGGVDSLPASYEHRTQWWANPGIDELRAWIAAHPPGAVVSVHYNPDWPPEAVPVPTPSIFDRYSNALSLRLAEIAAIVGLGLIALVFAIPR